MFTLKYLADAFVQGCQGADIGCYAGLPTSDQKSPQDGYGENNYTNIFRINLSLSVRTQMQHAVNAQISAESRREPCKTDCILSATHKNCQ